MQLVERARHDAEAFATLFRRHVHDVHRFVWRRTRNDMLADDITAATFEKCWRALPDFRPRRSSVRPWLFRIAANQLTDHVRSEARREHRQQLVAARDTASEDPGRHEPSGDDTQLLAALSRLGERDQVVLSLRFLADLSPAETAAAMRVSKRHCAVIQHRALAALRRVMEDDDV